METMREQWTDERLDDLNGKVDRGFERLDTDLRAQRVETRTEFATVRTEMKAEFGAVRTEMRAGFDRVDDRFNCVDDRFNRVDDRFDRIDERFERIDERFEALHRLLVQFCGLMLAALIGLIATQL